MFTWLTSSSWVRTHLKGYLPPRAQIPQSKEISAQLRSNTTPCFTVFIATSYYLKLPCFFVYSRCCPQPVCFVLHGHTTQPSTAVSTEQVLSTHLLRDWMNTVLSHPCMSVSSTSTPTLSCPLPNRLKSYSSVKAWCKYCLLAHVSLAFPSKTKHSFHCVLRGLRPYWGHSPSSLSEPTLIRSAGETWVCITALPLG